MTGRRRVDEQVLVGGGGLNGLCVQVIAVGPGGPPVVVAVNDAGPVRVLVAAGAVELVHGVAKRDYRETDEDAFLRLRLLASATTATMVSSEKRWVGWCSYAEVLLRRTGCGVGVAVVVGIVGPAALLLLGV